MITIEDLNFSFKQSSPILNDLSLNVPKGAIYGFIGSNGAGKSTTIRCILGLLTPQSGSIRVNGMLQPDDKKAIAKRTGFLVEAPRFYSNLTCLENLKLLTYFYNLNKSTIETVLKRLGLWEFRNRLFRRCSTGMKQRLGIARCILHNPALLVLDEPLNGLDPEWIVEIRELMKELNYNFGTTIFLSSHILSEMEKVVTHIGILRNGQLEFQGKIDELTKQTRSVQLTVVVESFDNYTGLESIPGVIYLGKEGNRLKFSAEESIQLNQLFQRLMTGNSKILEIITEKVGLEDLYIKYRSHGLNKK